MWLPKLIALAAFPFISLSLSAQDYYDFSDKYPDKGHVAITPIGGIINKQLGGTGVIGSGRIQYFISDNFSIGTQYVHLFNTGAEDFGIVGEWGAPEQSAHLIVGGHYFPSAGRFGFHGTAGIGLKISGEPDYITKGLTQYFDIGGDYKATKFLTIQLQFITVGFATIGVGVGLQFKP